MDPWITACFAQFLQENVFPSKALRDVPEIFPKSEAVLFDTQGSVKDFRKIKERNLEWPEASHIIKTL